MTRIPHWSLYQFMDDVAMNAAAATTQGAIESLSAAVFYTGFIAASNVTPAVTGLVMTLDMTGMSVVFGNGDVAACNGTVSNQTNTSYSIDTTGLVPASGTAQVYVVATEVEIGQEPYQVTGPPPGNPDYNPLFVPFTAYAQTELSVDLSATLTPPDNLTTIELFEFPLAAGTVTLDPATFAYAAQRKANILPVQTALPVTGTYNLSPGPTNPLYISGAALINLPDVRRDNGISIPMIAASSGTITVAASGADLIYGLESVLSSGASSVTLTNGSTTTFYAASGAWYARGGSAAIQLTGDVTGGPGVGEIATTIADNAVTTNKIADLNVTTGKLAEQAVTGEKIASGAVSTNELGTSGVTTVKIADGAITTPKIASGNVTSGSIATSGIVTSNIADSQVTNAKLANMASGTIKANNLSGAPQAPQDVTYADLLLSFGFDSAGISGNGSYRLSGGLILKWGSTGSATSGQGQYSYSFPSPFPTSCYAIAFQGVATTGFANADWILLLTTLTNSGFTVGVNSTGSATQDLSNIIYIAIGV